ncbi:MAG: MBL fold metallo-hydrolase [candidate division KSB1 bacterium]|nr:MBL fold metallo-hydrolase [candidate division KSB1 bacterium]
MKHKSPETALDITVLGSGTCAITPERSCAGYALHCRDQLIIMDMGFGALRRMMQANIDYREIDVILITHEHLDHSSDLAPLLMALHHTPGFIRRAPLTLVGPKGFKRFLTGCRDLYGDWLLENETFDLVIHELDNETLEIAPCAIKACPMHHSRPSVGYRIEYQERSLAYSGDTGMCDQVIDLNRDADLAILECSFPDDQPFEYHLTPEQVGTIAAAAGCRRLLLTHFYPMMENVDIIGMVKKQYNGVISLAYDLERIQV